MIKKTHGKSFTIALLTLSRSLFTNKFCAFWSTYNLVQLKLNPKKTLNLRINMHKAKHMITYMRIIIRIIKETEL